MVMCLGGTLEPCPEASLARAPLYRDSFYCHSRPPFSKTKSSIVYFPSQDAICASVIPRHEVINMWHSGTKRKLEEEESQLSYLDQRQSILNISMIKLRSPPARKVEQPLRRSVLIFNTLKHIETELKLEGVRWNPPTKPSLLPSLEPNDDVTLDHMGCTASTTNETKPAISDKSCCVTVPHSSEYGMGAPSGSVAMDTNPSCEVGGVSRTDQVASSSSSSSASSSSSLCAPACYSSSSSSMLPTQDSTVRSMSHSSSSSSSLSSSHSSIDTCTSPLFSDSRGILDSYFNFPCSQQGPLPTFSSLLDLDSCSSSTSAAGQLSAQSTSNQPAQHSTSRSSWSTPSCGAPSVSTVSPSAAAAALEQVQQDVLSDLDFSSLELEVFSFLPPNLKLTPLSPEDLQSLPHPETFPASCNPKHSDLLGDDLDSIMQLLVGI